jgi:phosphohistidine phosphatase
VMSGPWRPSNESLGPRADKSRDLSRHVRRAPAVPSLSDEQASHQPQEPPPGPGSLNRVSDHDRILVLMRHAKSAYPDGVADHDRPLATRGQREATLAGDWLRAQLPTIELVLCSTATRTRETLAHTGVDAPVRYMDRLYDSTPGVVIDQISSVAAGVSTLLVVGHEPTTSELALGLADSQTANIDAVEQISMKFPTSAIAVLRLDGSWADLELGSAQLVDFHVPR